MKRFALSYELEEEYNSINSEFKIMTENFNPKRDAFIPEDKEFTRRIVNFIINVLDYIIDNYEDVNVLEYQEFLGYYHFDFMYEKDEDEEELNYLDSNENNLDGKQLQDFCFELREEDFQASQEKLEEIRDRYVRFLEKN